MFVVVVAAALVEASPLVVVVCVATVGPTWQQQGTREVA